jgi:CBS-domain-containing membrane protein
MWINLHRLKLGIFKFVIQRRLAMKAADVMVSKVITVGPDTPVQEIANILLTNRVSAVPVVDSGGALIGIVSEGDLIHRVEAGTERQYSWWLRNFGDKNVIARDYLKSHAKRAADVMTKRVVTAPPDMPLAELAALLEQHRIKRVPIIDNDRLVGIVSRANLLQALASLRRDIALESNVADSTLRDKIFSEITEHMLASVSQINVIVRDGVVELWGDVESRDEKDAIRVAAEVVPGVRKVDDYIAVNTMRYGI